MISIIHGKDMAEHDARLERVLKRLEDSGLTLNLSKCIFRMTELEFLGFVLNQEGVSPAPSKVEAVKNARPPESAAEVRSFLGLVNFNAKFIKDLATKAEPLRKLTRKNAQFHWGEEQETAFKTLKNDLANAVTLTYFDQHAKTCVVADAGPVALGAVLIQCQNGQDRVISYASRSLSDVERRYSQTEKEALGLVWACERFHQYLYGIDFELVTDHRPLQFIYSPRSKPSARIERWVLRLQNYNFTVKYEPGHTNIADPLSRLVDTTTRQTCHEKADHHVAYIVKTTSAEYAVTMEEMDSVSKEDPEITQVRQCINSGKWDQCTVTSYRAVRDELTSFGNTVIRGTRLVVPEELRQRVLKIAHEGHQGIVKTKQRLRESVWWPGIDAAAEKICRSCHDCQLVSQPSAPEPMVRTKFPDKPWKDLAMDLLGPLPTGESLLVVVDYYSRYFEVGIMRKVTSEKIVDQLSRIFARHGLPESVTTDNGPQFVSEEFEKYMLENNIYHRSVTPLWPSANGEVERQNRSLLKAMKIAHAKGQDWKKELPRFLLAYRSTPHSTTGISPAELLFNRKIRTKLPFLCTTYRPEADTACDRDAPRKEAGKVYADKNRHAVDSDISVGQEVLLKQKRVNKFSTTFEPQPYQVVEKLGNQLVLQSPDKSHLVKRNITHTRPYVREHNVPVDASTLAASTTDHTTSATDLPTTSATPGTPVRRSGPVSPQPVPIRRSSRHCRPPDYLQDYACNE